MLKHTLFVLILLALSGSVAAQAGRIYVEPDSTYFQRDTFFTVVVRCDDNLIGVKGLHLNFDMNGGAAAVVAPAPETADTSVLLGDMFVSNDTVTFMWDYFWEDSTRLTVDIFVLSDSQTVSGPGELLIIRLNTVGFGETDISIVDPKARDRFNNEIPLTVAGAWVKVCQFVGDVDANNRININDLTYLVSYLFRAGPAPTPPEAGDVDCNGRINIVDVTVLVEYLFKGGSIDCDLCL